MEDIRFASPSLDSLWELLEFLVAYGVDSRKEATCAEPWLASLLHAVLETQHPGSTANRDKPYSGWPMPGGWPLCLPDAMLPKYPKVSVIVVSHNEGEYLRRTVDSLVKSLPANSEVIIVDDRSTDGSSIGLAERYPTVRTLYPYENLGVSRARNWGASVAQGDIFVFSDAHVEVEGEWALTFQELLARPEVGAVGPALADYHYRHSKGYGLRFCDDSANLEWLDKQHQEPYPVPLLGGFFFAMHRDVFARVGGFDEGMIRYGVEDCEMCLRLYALGYECLLVPSIEVAHLSTRLKAPPVYQRNWQNFLHNVLRMGFIHYGEERLRRLVAGCVSDPEFPAALSRQVSGDAFERRYALQLYRHHTDEEYFRRFNIL